MMSVKSLNPATLLTLALFAFAFSFTIFATQSGDVIIYLAFVRDLILPGQWSRLDPYLYSLSGAELVWTHEYLSYLVFYAAWSMAGIAGLIFLKAALLGSAFFMTLQSEPKAHNSSPLWIGLWVIAIIAASFRFIERSSLFSDIAGVLLVLWLLQETKITRQFLLRISLLFFLWIQLHPGFPIGLGLLGLWALWRTFYDRTIKIWDWRYLLLPVALMLINPEGLKGVTYPFEFTFNEAQTLKKFNFEWFASYHPAFRTATEVLAFWFLSGLSVLMFVRQGRRALLDLRFVFATAAIVIAVQTVRFIPWASFTLLIAVKPWAQFNFWPLARGRWAWAVTAILLTVAVKNFSMGYQSSSGNRLPQLGLDPKFFPIQTVAFLKNNPLPGRLYNTHDFGSYLIWTKMTPIFHHGFVTDMKFYEQEVIGVFQSQQNFLALAAKHGWTMLLIEKHGAFRRFHQLLYTLPEWKIVAEDEASYLIYKLP